MPPLTAHRARSSNRSPRPSRPAAPICTKGSPRSASAAQRPPPARALGATLMSTLNLRSAEDCHWDLVALGEVMLRLDPGELRVATTRQFRASEGGGEYNVARGLARCFGLRTGLVTALADNSVGRLVEDLIRQGGVEQAQLEWAPYD